MNNELQEAIDNAMNNLKSNRKAETGDAVSLSYDAGFVQGLKRAAEIVEKTFQEFIK